MTRTTTRWLLAALAALLAAWTLAPAATPIYDGIGQPDEPYRYVDPPQDAKTTKQPTQAKVSIGVRDGVSVNAYANSAEVGPQVSVYFPAGSLETPSGATAIAATATPEAAAPPLPSDGTIVSNVYRIAATVDGKDVRVIGTGHAAPTLQMRAPNAKLTPVFEHRTAAGWEKAQTARIGFDIYQTTVPALGDWALVQPSSASDNTSSSLTPVQWAMIIGGASLMVLALVIFAIRSSRIRRPA